MSEITLSVPDEILAALKVTPEEMAAELRLAAAAKLYEVGRLSSGVAAALAGVPRVLFLMKLREYGVPAIQLTAEELRQDSSTG